MAERSKVIRTLGVSTLIYPDKEQPVLKLNTTSLIAGEQYGVWGGLPDPGPRPMKLGQTILAFEHGPYDDVIDALKAAIDAHTDTNKVWSPTELKFLKAEYERKTAPASKKEAATKSDTKATTKGEPKISAGAATKPTSPEAEQKLKDQLKKIKSDAAEHKATKGGSKSKADKKDPKDADPAPQEPVIEVGSGTDAEGTPLVPEKEPEITA